MLKHITIYNIFLLLLILNSAQAQQVTKVECCVDLGTKATIIINNGNSANTTNSTSANTSTTAADNTCNFKLEGSANTSAGIYNSSDQLIRTLWSGIRYDAGCYNMQWDGLLDDGTQAPNGTYTAKILSNNVQYTWEGVVGNTSKNQTGAYIHKGYAPMQSAAIAGGKIFYGCGYSEAQSTQHFASLSNIQVRLDPLNGNTGQSTYFTCTDGNNVYWAGENANSQPSAREWFVFATDLNLNQITYPNSKSIDIYGGRHYDNLIDYTALPSGDSYITGMDVMKNGGNYLFTSRGNTNNIVHILNKTTGALTGTLALNTPGKIACDYSNHVWIASNANPAVKWTSSGAADDDRFGVQLAHDGDFSSFWAGNGGTNSWVEQDAGIQQTSTQIKIAARSGFEWRLVNSVIQGSLDNTNWTTLNTITSAPSADSYTTYSIPTSTYRYWRLYKANSSDNCDVAEIQFFPTPTNTTATNPVIQKFTVGSDGSLVYTGISINTISQPGGMAVSPTAGSLFVLDELTNQIKIFDPNTGQQTSVFGQPGGYANGPAITYDKFWLRNPGTLAFQSYIAFQPDGGYWLGDWGNYRMLHFSSSNSYIEQIAYVPHSRNTSVDMNDPTRIFANYIEYKRDYSKPLAGTNGSWYAVNNWGYGQVTISDYSGFFQVATLNNGRTYSNARELTSTGIRGINVEGQRIDANGNLYFTPGATGSSQVNPVYRKLRTGFDSYGNPVYGNQSIFVSPPANDYVTPSFGGSNIKMHNSNPKRWLFSNLKNYGGFHTGLVTVSKDGTWQSLFTPSTNPNYRGEYPLDGTLDIGNIKNDDNAESHMIDNYIFWNDHGEFYKGGTEQPNIWAQYLDDGLFIGSFGRESRGTADTFEAGNVFSSDIVKFGDNYYVYHCDESIHQGVHAIKVSNLNSITEQNVSITLSSNQARKNADNIDLMANVPSQSSDYKGDNYWSVSNPSYNDKWFIKTNILSYKKSAPDIFINVNDNASHTITCNLGSNNTTNWTLSGKLAWQGMRVYQNNNNINLQILDATGKALTNFTVNFDPSNSYRSTMKFNTEKLVTLEDGDMTNLLNSLNSFIIKNTNGTITMSYAGYKGSVTVPFTAGAKLSNPASLIININSENTQIAISELKFKPN